MFIRGRSIASWTSSVALALLLAGCVQTDSVGEYPGDVRVEGQAVTIPVNGYGRDVEFDALAGRPESLAAMSLVVPPQTFEGRVELTVRSEAALPSGAETPTGMFDIGCETVRVEGAQAPRRPLTMVLNSQTCRFGEFALTDCSLLQLMVWDAETGAWTTASAVPLDEGEGSCADRRWQVSVERLSSYKLFAAPPEVCLGSGGLGLAIDWQTRGYRCPADRDLVLAGGQGYTLAEIADCADQEVPLLIALSDLNGQTPLLSGTWSTPASCPIADAELRWSLEPGASGTIELEPDGTWNLPASRITLPLSTVDDAPTRMTIELENIWGGRTVREVDWLRLDPDPRFSWRYGGLETNRDLALPTGNTTEVVLSGTYSAGLPTPPSGGQSFRIELSSIWLAGGRLSLTPIGSTPGCPGPRELNLTQTSTENLEVLANGTELQAEFDLAFPPDETRCPMRLTVELSDSLDGPAWSADIDFVLAHLSLGVVEQNVSSGNGGEPGVGVSAAVPLYFRNDESLAGLETFCFDLTERGEDFELESWESLIGPALEADPTDDERYCLQLEGRPQQIEQIGTFHYLITELQPFDERLEVNPHRRNPVTPSDWPGASGLPLLADGYLIARSNDVTPPTCGLLAELFDALGENPCARSVPGSKGWPTPPDGQPAPLAGDSFWAPLVATDAPGGDEETTAIQSVLIQRRISGEDPYDYSVQLPAQELQDPYCWEQGAVGAGSAPQPNIQVDTERSDGARQRFYCIAEDGAGNRNDWTYLGEVVFDPTQVAPVPFIDYDNPATSPAFAACEPTGPNPEPCSVARDTFTVCYGVEGDQTSIGYLVELYEVSGFPPPELRAALETESPCMPIGELLAAAEGDPWLEEGDYEIRVTGYRFQLQSAAPVIRELSIDLPPPPPAWLVGPPPVMAVDLEDETQMQRLFDYVGPAENGLLEIEFAVEHNDEMGELEFAVAEAVRIHPVDGETDVTVYPTPDAAILQLSRIPNVDRLYADYRVSVDVRRPAIANPDAAVRLTCAFSIVPFDPLPGEIELAATAPQVRLRRVPCGPVYSAPAGESGVEISVGLAFDGTLAPANVRYEWRVNFPQEVVNAYRNFAQAGTTGFNMNVLTGNAELVLDLDYWSPHPGIYTLSVRAVDGTQTPTERFADYSHQTFLIERREQP